MYPNVSPHSETHGRDPNDCERARPIQNTTHILQQRTKLTRAERWCSHKTMKTRSERLRNRPPPCLQDTPAICGATKQRLCTSTKTPWIATTLIPGVSTVSAHATNPRSHNTSTCYFPPIARQPRQSGAPTAEQDKARGGLYLAHTPTKDKQKSFFSLGEENECNVH
jgi:hypothetical protein